MGGGRGNGLAHRLDPGTRSQGTTPVFVASGEPHADRLEPDGGMPAMTGAAFPIVIGGAGLAGLCAALHLAQPPSGAAHGNGDSMSDAVWASCAHARQ